MSFWLRHKKALKRMMIGWWIIWQTLLAALAFIWITALGHLARKLPVLDRLPDHLPSSLLVGLGIIICLVSVVLFIFGVIVTLERWFEWNTKRIRKWHRNFIWDLEHEEEERRYRAYRKQLIENERLAELKNAQWEV